MKSVALLLTHIIDEHILELYDDIRDGFAELGDAFVLLHDENDATDLSVPHFKFTMEDVKALGYPMLEESLIPGSCHLPIFLFLKDRPNYSSVWLIEYDVRYTGQWREFFHRFSQPIYDFCTSHIRPYQQEPMWDWWQLEHARKQIPLVERTRSFNPIYRISDQALKFIEQCIKEGWQGHHEVLLATLLHNNGFRIVDFGGTGDFVENNNAGRFYTSKSGDPSGSLTSGSMRFRPPISTEEIDYSSHQLYHPCKPPRPRKPLYKRVLQRVKAYQQRPL